MIRWIAAPHWRVSLLGPSTARSERIKDSHGMMCRMCVICPAHPWRLLSRWRGWWWDDRMSCRRMKLRTLAIEQQSKRRTLTHKGRQYQIQWKVLIPLERIHFLVSGKCAKRGEGKPRIYLRAVQTLTRSAQENFKHIIVIFWGMYLYLHTSLHGLRVRVAYHSLFAVCFRRRRREAARVGLSERFNIENK